MTTPQPGASPGCEERTMSGSRSPTSTRRTRFLVDVLGCEQIYVLGAKQADDDWMHAHLGVHPRTVIREIRFYRLGHGANFEVFLYEAADGQAPQPRNSDIGGHHFAFYVDDIDRAVDHLRAHGVEVMGRAHREQAGSRGPALGVLPQPVGHPVRARELSRREGVREGRRPAALAPGTPCALTRNTIMATTSVVHGGTGARIADTLRDAILAGEYLPGERIRQDELADRHGASRVPVREALRILESEGLMRLVANAGAWVSEIGAEECQEMYQMRERLEPLLLRMNVPLLDDGDVERLRSWPTPWRARTTSSTSCGSTGSSTCPVSTPSRRACSASPCVALEPNPALPTRSHAAVLLGR